MAVDPIRDIEDERRRIQKINSLARAEFLSTVERVHKHLAANIVAHKGDSSELICLRRLGHLRFHVHDGSEDTELYHPIIKLYPILYNKFMSEKGISQTEPPKPTSFRSKTEVVESEEQLLQNTEEINIDLQLNQNQIVDDGNYEADDMYIPNADDLDVFRVDDGQNLCPNLPSHIEICMEQNVADIIGEDLPEVDDLRKDLAKLVTLIRECDDQCPKINTKEAGTVYETLRQFVGSIDHNFDAEYTWAQHQKSIHERHPLLQSSVSEWIRRHSTCYQGLRSLTKRLNSLKKQLTLLAAIKLVFEEKDEELREKVLSMDMCSDELKMKFLKEYPIPRDDQHHTEGYIKEKFHEVIVRFREEMKNQETGICDICNQYTVEKELSCRNVDRRFFAANRDKELQQVCRMCWRAISTGSTPPAAEVNEMALDEMPEELTSLNVVEQMLIQRVRAIQNIFHLRDIGGKSTAMKGTTGNLVLVPVTIQETVSHVADVLPSASKMILHVAAPWERTYLVSLPKVLTALYWLKRHNPLYADVKIDERFSFTLNENVVFEKQEVSQEDVDKLIQREEDDGHLLTQTHFDVDPLRDVGLPEDDSRLAVDKYRLRRDKYQPMSVDTSHVDELVLPVLHSRGRYGFSEARKTKVGLAKYIRSRLLNADRRFATSTHYLALMFGLRVQKDMTSGMGIQARVKSGSTFDDLDKSLKDDEFTTQMSSIYSNMRGYAAYWNTVRLDLRAHVVKYGAPTFFITLNPNECSWPDLHEIYARVTGRNVTAENIRDEIALDPVHFSRYWRRRINAFFKHVITAKDGPFGEVRHYFYRVEYQHRGTQHVHAVIWVNKRPAPDAPPSEIASFIDRFLTARMPCQEAEPELHQVIANHQCHWRTHTKTCLRVFKYKGRMVRKCRFEFPRPVLPRTFIYKDRDAHKVLKAGKKDYYLARTINETMINDYCPLISLLWNGNTDVQYVHSDSRGVANYVSAYTTKGEKAKQERFATANALKLDSSRLNPNSFNALVNMINQRQCGSLELVDHLCSHRCYAFDSSHTFIPTDLQENRSRILIPKKERAGSELCYYDNFVDCYYPKRHKLLEGFSLMNVLINFEVVTSKRKGPRRNLAKELPPEPISSPSHSSEESSDDEALGLESYDKYGYHDAASPFFCHPHMKSGTLLNVQGKPEVTLRKKKQSVPRFYLPRASNKDTEKLEDYFRRLCMLLVPWRDENKQLEHGNANSFHELFENFSNMMRHKHPRAWGDIERYLANMLQLQNQDDIIRNRLEALKQAMNELNVEEEVGDEIEVQRRTVDVELHTANIERMNLEQRKIFMKITERISKQEEEATRNIGKEHRSPALRHFISGTAGTGKSFLITLLADEVTVKYADPVNQSLRPSVLICAPTGLAAVQIKGTTIHSLLAIEVQNGNDPMFRPLKDGTRDMKRALFSNVRLLIIDEISMCSNVLLLKIHLRLVEITGNKSPFGGLNIIALGDLLQLPAVRAASIFNNINPQQLSRVFQSMSVNINLWNTFHYSELTENMRQRDDLEFAEIMNRMRVNQMTDDDRSKLKDRIIPCKGEFASFAEMATYFVVLQQSDPNCMALFPKLVEAEEFNRQVMELLHLSTSVVKAEDVIVESAVQQGRRLTTTAKKNRPWQWTQFSLTRPRIRKVDEMPSSEPTSIPQMAGGLPLTLTLAEGARIMLRRNIDAPNGLVNGSTGCLEKISRDSNNCPDKLFIRFDINPNKLTEISRCTAYYDMSGEERRCRTQFPIVMCFACTIHKAQGMTLKNVLVSTRSCFGAGQVFVACSRVQNLHGLHLADFNDNLVKVDSKCLTEYNRLRNSIGLTPFPHPHTSAAPSEATDRRNIRDLLAVRVGAKSRAQRSFMSTENEELYISAIPSIVLSYEGIEERACMEKSIYACLHILTMIRPVGKHIMSTEGEEDDAKKTVNRTLVLIQDVLSRRQQNARYLVSHLMENNVSGRGTFLDVLEFITRQLPAEVRETFTFSLLDTRKCPKCHRELAEKAETAVIDLEACARLGKLSKVAEHAANATKQEVSCERCSINFVRKRNFSFSPKHEYLIFFQGGENKLTRPSLDGEIMFGRRWLMVGSAHNLRKIPTMYHRLPSAGYIKCVKESATNVKSLAAFFNANIIVMKENRYTRKGNDREPANEGKTDYIFEIDELARPNDAETHDSEEGLTMDRRFDCLPLKNNGSDCFLNVTISLLYSCDAIRQRIETSRNEDSPRSPFVKLRELFTHASNNPFELRQTLPKELRSGQNDVGDCLPHILEILPADIREMFTIRKIKTGHCISGCGIFTEQVQRYEYLISLGGRTDSINALENYFTGATESICNTCSVKQPAILKADITRDTQYLFINQRTGPNGTPFELVDINKPIQLLGYMWKIMSFVEYIPSLTGPFGSAGHYVTWIPHGRGFWRVDDDKVTIETEGLTKLHSCVLFALELIH